MLNHESISEGDFVLETYEEIHPVHLTEQYLGH
jgi:hypothetical protein